MAFANPADIEMLILDVDGVLTAGEVILDETGKVSYHFNVQDGSGIKYWYRYGGQAAIVTGRSSEAVLVRAKELGIEIVYQSALRKIEAYRRCLADCRSIRSGWPVWVTTCGPALCEIAAFGGGEHAVRKSKSRRPM